MKKSKINSFSSVKEGNEEFEKLQKYFLDIRKQTDSPSNSIEEIEKREININLQNNGKKTYAFNASLKNCFPKPSFPDLNNSSM